MKKQIEALLENPEVKELAVSALGIAAGFVAQRLIMMALRRTSIGLAGKLIQVGIAAWVTQNPEVVGEWTKRLFGFDHLKKESV